MDREKLFKRLDEYCSQRFIEVGRRRLERPMLKTYVFETARTEHDSIGEFQSLGVLSRVDEGLCELSDEEGPLGYLEDIGRFKMLYTLLPTEQIEPLLGRLVKNSQMLDNLWLSGETFRVLFENVAESFDPWRFIRMAMGHSPIFEMPRDYAGAPSLNDQDIQCDRSVGGKMIHDCFTGEITYDSDGLFAEELEESPTSRLLLSNRLRRAGELVRLFRSAREFRNITMLRVPAFTTAGGHEFHFYGKVTNRSSDFFDHRRTVMFVVRSYEYMTKLLEDEVWLGPEKIDTGDKSGICEFRGAPVTIEFPMPLARTVFERFLELTFEKGKGPFKLWGNLLERGPNCYHVYGLDLHLVQEIFLELTPERFTVMLPRGTCGNTIHRLVTNVQRYLAPDAEVWVGSKTYIDYAREAFKKIGSQSASDAN
ncbi:MAG TPA: hypothetical protein GXX40_01625 [Firmicutes bacterium]|nr:hypothetical protein [Bacillota bacterium]